MSLIELPQLIFQRFQRKLTMVDMLLGYCNNYPQKVYFSAFELLFSLNCMHGQLHQEDLKFLNKFFKVHLGGLHGNKENDQLLFQCLKCNLCYYVICSN